jgi:hypothetical protein
MATMASTEMTSDNDNPEKLQDRLRVSWLLSELMVLYHFIFRRSALGFTLFYCNQERAKGKRGKAS